MASKMELHVGCRKKPTVLPPGKLTLKIVCLSQNEEWGHKNLVDMTGIVFQK